jgi:hypothetical protein
MIEKKGIRKIQVVLGKDVFLAFKGVNHLWRGGNFEVLATQLSRVQN